MTRDLFILDACVLIDLVEVDASLLTLVAEQVGTIYVASVVLDEVRDLDESTAISLGCRIFDPALEVAVAAADYAGGMSLEDWTCVLLAEKHNWICVSNDKLLRRECERRGVDVLWSLALLELLVVNQALTVDEAIAVAGEMHALNPYCISKAIVQRFAEKLGGR